MVQTWLSCMYKIQNQSNRLDTSKRSDVRKATSTRATPATEPCHSQILVLGNPVIVNNTTKGCFLPTEHLLAAPALRISRASMGGGGR